MEFVLLGGITVLVDGVAVDLGPARQRCVLAALAVDAGRVVSVDRLVERVWGDAPPLRARATLLNYLSRLRLLLAGAATVVRRPGGYALEVERSAVDLLQFRDLCGQARAAGDQQAVELLGRALELWRGEALTGIEGDWAAAERNRLHQQLLDAECDLTEVRLRLGHGEDLVAALSARSAQWPLDERVACQFMLALHRAGRTPDALAEFRRVHETFIEELGIEPGVELSRLHEAILRTDPALLGIRATPIPPEPAAVPPQSLAPKQLPPDAADFTGRDELVSELVEALTDGRPGPVVAALLGPGGVGKSALAVHVAHQVSSAYPDGQLHVDLRGTTNSASPSEVLGRFLRALQPNQKAIPDEVDERMDAYRTLMSGRRMLIVLDDAENEQQARPLLPGAGTCSVLLTSRTRLAGLAGAHLVELDMLSQSEATALLARVAGHDRVTAAPDAVADIVASCGNLPLAIRIAGARLATRRQWTPRLLADRLTDERRRLDELAAGDQRIRASIELSFRGLPPAAQTAIRRLGHLGPADFRSWVVARALDIPISAAEQVIEQLVDDHLVDYTFVDDTGQVRYRLHDLVRIYAREEADRHEPRADLAASTARVVGGWSAVLDRLHDHIVDHVHSGAVPLISPATRCDVAGDMAREVLGTALADPRGWLDAEQASLVLGVERAAELGLDELAVDVASVLCMSGYALNNVQDLWHRAHRAALAAARAAGNAHGEAILLAELGQLRYEQDRFADARVLLIDAVERFRDLHDPRGEASALSTLGLTCRDQGDLLEAEHFLAQAAALCDGLADDHATGHCQRLIGSVQLERGNFDAADAALDRALNAYRLAGSVRGEALTLRTIGLTYRACGRLTEAEEAFTGAMALFRRLGDTSLIAFCLRGLAKTHIRMGRIEEAREPLEAVLATHQAERDTWAEAMALRTLGELDLAAGRLDDAGRWFASALRIFRTQGAAVYCARTLRDIARLEQVRGNDTAAKAALAEAIETFRTHGSREYDELRG